MLAPDDKNSVLSQVSGAGRKARAYSAYGYSADDATTDSGLGYNGELRDSTTGHYILGKGYRVFSPQMMRFYSPDSWSPFGEGGVNAYGYVSWNPMKYKDPTGHTPFALFLIEVAKGIVKNTPENRAAARLASNSLKLQQETGAAVASTATKDVASTIGLKDILSTGASKGSSAKNTVSFADDAPSSSTPAPQPVTQQIVQGPKALELKPQLQAAPSTPSTRNATAQPKRPQAPKPHPNQAEIDRYTAKINKMNNSRHAYMIDEQKISGWREKIAELRSS